MQTEPELQNREPIRHDSFDDGVVVDHVYANSSQFLDGVLKVQSIYDDIVTKRKTTNDAVVFLNPSVGINEEFERASQPTKTTPNVMKYSTIHKKKPKTARVVNPLPTAKKPKKRARISATSSNPNITSNDPPFLDDPIYQSISDIEL